MARLKRMAGFESQNFDPMVSFQRLWQDLSPAVSSKQSSNHELQVKLHQQYSVRVSFHYIKSLLVNLREQTDSYFCGDIHALLCRKMMWSANFRYTGRSTTTA